MIAYMYALCVSGAVNTQGFVWKFFYALYIYSHSFIHSNSPSSSSVMIIIYMSCHSIYTSTNDDHTITVSVSLED